MISEKVNDHIYCPTVPDEISAYVLLMEMTCDACFSENEFDAFYSNGYTADEILMLPRDLF